LLGSRDSEPREQTSEAPARDWAAVLGDMEGLQRAECSLDGEELLHCIHRDGVRPLA